MTNPYSPSTHWFPIRPILIAVALLTLLSAGASFGQAKQGSSDAFLPQEVHHRLVLIPWYSVFDNLTYSVNGSEVTLGGEVTNSRVKSDAEKAVGKIDGVTKIINNIEVLPNLPNDDPIRRAVFRAIYSDASLGRHAMGAVPSIHIVVENGHVTLEGMVENKMDQNVAYIRAHGVPGVSSVTNNLRVESDMAQ